MNSSTKHLTSCVCKQEDFEAPWYEAWRFLLEKGATRSAELNDSEDSKTLQSSLGNWLSDKKTLRRKFWEWCIICQALNERGLLAPRKKGIGFAVGNEPLSSAFASFGCDVLASDYFSGPLADAWKTSNELGDSLESIY